MNYKFKYKNTPFELLRLSLFYLYTSLAGIVNIIFTFAMLALLYSKWNETEAFVKLILSIAVLFFVLFQPAMMYMKVRENAKDLPELELEFGERGIAVGVGGKHEFIPWNKIRSVKSFPGMLIIFTDATNGYILTKRIVGIHYKSIFEEISGKVKNG